MGQTTQNRYKQILGRYLPEKAVDLVFDFLYINHIGFKITKKRRSKLGDYKWFKYKPGYYEISVNGDLNKYAFMLVLMHEMAHHLVHLQYGESVQPHGHEWQRSFADTMKKYIGMGVFPSDVANAMAVYSSSIPLKIKKERELMSIINRYNENANSTPEITLNDVPLNTLFKLENHERVFRSVEKRRTRYKCVDIKTNEYFLVQGTATIFPMEAE